MNGQLSNMAVTDQLTGLYNRQGFENLMNKWTMYQKIQKIIVYMDMDNFKYYNDTFGHELGDYVLIRFSKMLMEKVKNYGHAVRYGGDEFVVILDEKDISFAKVFAKDILNQLEESVINGIHERIGRDVIIPANKKLTCSIGIAECNNSNQVTEALSRADAALYYVKKNTKNNYVVWDEIKDKLTENQ
jgi:diguanylate cyclase (GGDEF)-like protein